MNVTGLRQLLQQAMLNPYPRYRRMRADHPIWYDARNAIWHVFRYDDAVRVLSETAMFSSHFRGKLQAICSPTR